MPRVAVRRPSVSEADAVAALVNAHALATHGEPSLTPQTVREWLDDPAIDMRVVAVGEQLVCYGDLVLASDGSRADLDIREHPDHPGSAVPLLEALEAAAGQRGATSCRAYAYDSEAPYIALLDARDYRAIRHSFELVASLTDELEAPVVPPGILVRPAEPGQERLVYDAHAASFVDHWGFEPRPFDDWSRYFVGRADADLSLMLLAWDGVEVVGLCLCRPHQSAVRGYGWIDVLGVLPRWRRRGLGLALLLHGFAELRARDFERVGLGVDGQSATGALELYERAGMRVMHRQDTFERALRRGGEF